MGHSLIYNLPMTTLRFKSPAAKKKVQNKAFALLLGVALLGTGLALSSTLAANININSGPIEFGQGVAQTTACDSEILMVPNSTFINADGAGEFMFSGITLSHVDSTVQSGAGDDGCMGKVFTINLFDQAGSKIGPSILLSDNGTNFSSPAGDVTSSDDPSRELTTATLTFASPSISARSIYRITVESGAPTGQLIWKTFLFTETEAACTYAEILSVTCDGENTGLSTYWESDGFTEPSESGRRLCDSGTSSTIDYLFNDVAPWADPDPGNYDVLYMGAHANCPGQYVIDHWTGHITIPGTYDGATTQTIRFFANTDDAFKLTIGGQDVITDWHQQGTGVDEGVTYCTVDGDYQCNDNAEITLLTGQTYTFEVWHNQGRGGSTAQLGWNLSSDGSTVVVPASAFSAP